MSGLNTIATHGGTVTAYGIQAWVGPITLAGNSVFGLGTTGISGLNVSSSFCAGNTISRFTTAMVSCANDGGNGLH